jgi:hypothetical protein
MSSNKTSSFYQNQFVAFVVVVIVIIVDAVITSRTCALVGVGIELRAFSSVLTRRWTAGVISALTFLTSVALITSTPEK